MAFEWLANDANYTIDTLIQRYALATLFFGTDGDSWNNNTLWLSNADMCEWHKVVCANDSVSELDLALHELSGELPPEIGLLSSLGKFIIDARRECLCLTSPIKGNGGISSCDKSHLILLC